MPSASSRTRSCSDVPCRRPSAQEEVSEPGRTLQRPHRKPTSDENPLTPVRRFRAHGGTGNITSRRAACALPSNPNDHDGATDHWRVHARQWVTWAQAPVAGLDRPIAGEVEWLDRTSSLAAATSGRRTGTGRCARAEVRLSHGTASSPAETAGPANKSLRSRQPASLGNGPPPAVGFAWRLRRQQL